MINSFNEGQVACKKTALLVLIMFAAVCGSVTAKPLKIYILAGQSNMEGAAMVDTFDYIGNDPATAPMLKEMRGPDGKPRVCDKVWISYFTGMGNSNGEGFGKLTAGYGSRGNPAESGGKIGPEFTFGIYMQKELNEPILIIKTAWGGKSLHTDFRSPSAGPYKLNAYQQELYTEHPGAHGVPKDLDKWKADKVKATGKYYRLMMDHVKMVLADIKRVCPVYDEKEGYELAGFAWFQGWNDMCDGHTYPNNNKPGSYAEYTSLMAHFIRDVRKDLSAPKMSFVIGVIGVGGDKVKGGIANLRPAMAAPAAMPEFKGNVAAVETAPYWDFDMAALESKVWVKNLVSEDVKIIAKDGFIEKTQTGEPRWEPIGKTRPQDRVWRFISFDPQKKEDVLVKTEKKRFRDVTLPAGLKKWQMPDFDDSKWNSGKTPVGKGDWPLGYFKDAKVKSRSDWGSGEFLLMRNTFEVDNLDYESYRISILARQGYHVYLNGHKIHTYIWWKDAPHYQSLVLRREHTRHLKKGVNVLAVYANVQYDRRTKVPHAAIDLWIEGITKDAKKYVSNKENVKRRVDRKMKMVFTPRENSILKGCSNAGYHYLGSAKILGQIGKAFAEAMIEMESK